MHTIENNLFNRAKASFFCKYIDNLIYCGGSPVTIRFGATCITNKSAHKGTMELHPQVMIKCHNRLEAEEFLRWCDYFGMYWIGENKFSKNVSDHPRWSPNVVYTLGVPRIIGAPHEQNMWTVDNCAMDIVLERHAEREGYKIIDYTGFAFEGIKVPPVPNNHLPLKPKDSRPPLEKHGKRLLLQPVEHVWHLAIYDMERDKFIDGGKCETEEEAHEKASKYHFCDIVKLPKKWVTGLVFTNRVGGYCQFIEPTCQDEIDGITRYSFLARPDDTASVGKLSMFHHLFITGEFKYVETSPYAEEADPDYYYVVKEFHESKIKHIENCTNQWDAEKQCMIHPLRFWRKLPKSWERGDSLWYKNEKFELYSQGKNSITIRNGGCNLKTFDWDEFYRLLFTDVIIYREPDWIDIYK